MLFRTFALFVILITDQNGSLATTPTSDNDEAFEEGLDMIETLGYNDKKGNYVGSFKV